MKQSKPTMKDVQQLEEMYKNENYDAASEFRSKFDWSSELTGESQAHGLKNCVGEQIVPNEFQDFQLLSVEYLKKDSRVVAQKNDLWGVLKTDGSGSWIVAPEYDSISFPNQLVKVGKNGKFGVLDILSKEFVVPLEMDEINGENNFLFVNGISIFSKDGKFGLLNQNGNVTKPIFDEVDFDSEAKVRLGDKWGYANEEGEFTEDSDEGVFYDDL